MYRWEDGKFSSATSGLSSACGDKPQLVGGVGESYLQELKGKDSNSLIHWKSYFLSNDELYEEINNSDVLVLPYREISQSGVLLLSIYFEKNIICSDLPSFVETIHGDQDNSLDHDFFFKNHDKYYNRQ